MKNLMKGLLIFLLVGVAEAQTTFTPNLNLGLPPAADGTWGETYNNNFTILDSVVAGGFTTDFALAGDISPAQITTDQHNYNPTGLADASTLRLSTDASRNLTGIVGGADGRLLLVHNVGSFNLVLVNDSSSSLTQNRFAIGANITLGANQGLILQYDSTSFRWRAASGISGSGSNGHVIADEGSGLNQRPTLNFTGTGVTCADNSGANRTDCTIAAGTVDQAAAYVWTGTNSWRDANWSLLDDGDTSKILKFDLSGFTTATTRTWTGPNATTRLLGDSDFSTTGCMGRTGTNTYAGRTITGTTNRITVTNGDCVAGNPTLNVGSLVVQTDQSNTWTTGDQDFNAVNSLRVPVATGAAPTISGRIAYDSTAHRWKGGVNGATKTFSYSDEVQPLNANLTSLAALTGVNNGVPIFTGAGTFTSATIPSCADTGGQHLNYDAASHVWSCGTSSTGGLSGLTTGKLTKALSASTIGNSIVTESGSDITVGGGLIVGAAGPYLIWDTSAIASTDKTYSVINFSGTIRPSTGALTPGNIVTTNASGQFVDGGAAGSGTWTDSSTNTGTNKTLVATEAGGTNTLTTGINAYWDGGALIPDGVQCADATKQTINSGPTVYTFSCADNAASIFSGQLALNHSVATVTFTLTVNDVDSSAQHFAGDFKAQCRNNATTVDGTWGTAQTVDITMTTANQNYTGTTAAVTPNGTCSAGATLFWRFTMNATTNTDDGDARVIGVLMKQAS